MPTSVFYGYSSDALVYDPNTGSFTLDPNYDFRTDRVRFEITDDDNFLDGDEKNDEVGEDANQTGVVTMPDGTPVSSGLIYGEQYAVLQAPDGSYVTIDRIEIDGVKMGYVPSEPLQPGVSYSYVGGRDIDNLLGGPDGDDTRQTYAAYEADSVPCFGPGTMIQTQEGEIPVEWLETSDMVLTRDHGYQPILWIGRTRIPYSHFIKNPDDRPLCIPAGSLSTNIPTHDLHVTGDHRVLLTSTGAELLYFESEVLAPAKAWLDRGVAHQISPEKDYTVTHIVCARHQVIVAQGAWVETMFPGPEALKRMSADNLARLKAVLGPELYEQRTARPCLSRKEARLLIEPVKVAGVDQRHAVEKQSA
ncbi:Hint domain-containing protein [uncultured Roseobacter sp.]|uniref:Hint domain-containing protein n=1 Tax=uncultured Roseobacter sp. TaxID=114847 RepID=UPI002609DB2E|nr:Hint domain-containing protein [uncultured Roseobacter sp.]